MGKVTVSFFGVRGSTPCCTPELARFGGNTSCVVIDADGIDPIILDMGTGLRAYGRGVQEGDPFRGAVLLTHLHWDHVQGLPFFQPLNDPSAGITVYGPPDDDRSLGDAFDEFMSPPYFPIRCDELNGDVAFRDVQSERFDLGAARITSRSVPHIGATNGYRIDIDGYSIAYIPDHQQPLDATVVDERVLELCDGADLVIHDAQYTDDQFARRSNWGHCTMNYATEVARQAQANALVLFHHDPANDDILLTDAEEQVRYTGESKGLGDVMAAAEGDTIKLG